MNYWEAIDASVTAEEALEELQKHEINAQVRESDKALIDIETGDVIGEVDENGDYYGGDVIGYLGY